MSLPSIVTESSHTFSLYVSATQDMLDLIRKLVLWLIEQRDENGGFTTTQDTVVGLHALSEYMIWSNTAVSWNLDCCMTAVISSNYYYCQIEVLSTHSHDSPVHNPHIAICKQRWSR